MQEKWKEIDGYSGMYEVSNLGNIRSNWGKSTRKRAFSTMPNRYPLVTLSLNGITKTYSVHRLVALAFLRRVLGKNIVNHKDGNKSNNTVSNLEWVSNSENEKHSYRELGKHPNTPNKGRYGPNSFRAVAIALITGGGKMLKKWGCARDAAKELNLQESNINHVLRGRRKSTGGFKFVYLSKKGNYDLSTMPREL